MKILVDSQIFGLQRTGGISRYFVELLSEFRSIAEVDARVLAPFHKNLYLRKSIVQSEGFCIFSGGIREGVRRRANDIASDFFLSRTTCDVFHASYYERHTKPINAGSMVVTVHDMIHELMPSSFPPNDLTSRLKKAAVDAADHIICVSENTRADLCRLFNVDTNRTTVVHHGVRSSSFSGSDLFSFYRPYLLYVGHRGGYKNFTVLLRALSSPRIRNLEIGVIAFGGGGFSRTESELLQRLRIEPNSVVQISGDDATLSSLYRGAIGFVYPSAYEGFGMPLLEAMAAGCPVLTSRNSSIPEVAGECAEYFEASSEEDLACAIERVVSSDSRKRELVELGRTRADLFSWNKAAKKTLDVYMKCNKK